MIQSISLKNFRGIKEGTYAFGPGKNIVSGPNEVGKTTLAHALAFTFYGYDLQGTKNPDHLIMLGEETTEVAVQTSKATFIRRKKRGGQSAVKLVREGFPEIKPNQGELVQLMGMDYDLFASASVVGYFMGLTAAKQREVISQAWPVDRRTLLQSLLPAGIQVPREVKLENPRLDATAMSRSRQARQNSRAADAGAYAQVMAQLQEHEGLVTEVVSEDTLSKLRAEAQLIDMYERELKEYNRMLEVYHARGTENNHRLAQQEKLQLEAMSLGKAPEGNPIALQEQAKTLRKSSVDIQFIQVPPAPLVKADLDDPYCPRCGTAASDNLRASIKAERAKLLTDYNQTERGIEDQNQKLREKKAGLDKQADDVQNQANSLLQAQSAYRLAKDRLAASYRASELVENVEPAAPVAPQVSENAKTNLRDLEAKIAAIKLVSERTSGVLARKATLEKAIETHTKAITDLSAIEEALKALPDVEVGQTAERFKLHKATVVFTEGELSVSDDRGIPYASLSSGRRMKMDLEWCKCFRRLLKNPPPFLFIDNADLVDSFAEYSPDEGIQTIFAKVDLSSNTLKVVVV